MAIKLWVIAYNGIYRIFRDPVALIFMFAAPLAISFILGVAFGGDVSQIELPDSTLIIVNQDEGIVTADGTVSARYGDYYESILVSNPPQELQDLINGKVENDPAKAREQVENGDARATLIIPPDFSQRVLNDEEVSLELYYNPGSEIGVTIIIAVTQSLTSSINNGQVAQQILLGNDQAAIEAMTISILRLINDPQSLTASPDVQTMNLLAFYIGESRSVVVLNEVNVEGEQQEVNILSYIAPSMAILFMTFAMSAGTRIILQEQQNWTMQRILSTPTPRWLYLGGRLWGAFLTGVIQMVLLFVVTPIVGLIASNNTDIWGNNYIGLGLMIMAVVFAGTGLGLVIAAISKNDEQANILSTPILFISAMIGGSFIMVDNIPIVSQLRYLTLNHWGIDGIFELAVNDASIIDILPHVAALTVMGIVFFGISLYRFNRRLDF